VVEEERASAASAQERARAQVDEVAMLGGERLPAQLALLARWWRTLLLGRSTRQTA
jgi:hypothetical protein